MPTKAKGDGRRPGALSGVVPSLNRMSDEPIQEEPIEPERYHCPDGPPGSNHSLHDRRGEQACRYCGRTRAALVEALTPPWTRPGWPPT